MGEEMARKQEVSPANRRLIVISRLGQGGRAETRPSDAAGCDTIGDDAAVECRNLTHPPQSSRATKVFCMSLGLGVVVSPGVCPALDNSA